MNRLTIGLLSLFVGFAVSTTRMAAARPAPEASLQDRLIGTWKMVSARYGGQEHKFPEGTTTLKHVTPSQFMWASYGADGTVTRAAGGRYTLKGDVYEETPEYGLSGDFDAIKGKAQTFKCVIDGDKWHHDGKLSNGLTIEEVWERVGRK